MKGFRASLLVVSALLLPVSVLGQASSQPSVTNAMPTNDFGFNLPTHLGTLSYALSGSEGVGTAYGNGSLGSSTSLSGDLAYISRSQNDPFSLIYSGGYIFSTVTGSSESSTFQNIAASQVFRTKSWVYVITDTLNYLPESPTTGLSGIAGVGDIGVFPVQTGLGPTQSILTGFSNRLANGLQGSATWQMTPSLDLEGSAGWNKLSFNNSNAYSSDDYTGTFGPSYRIDARNQIGVQANYSLAKYPNFSSFKIESRGVNLNYTRAWTRRLTTTVSFGPEITHGQTITPIASQTNFAGTASMSYATRTTGFYGSYSRGVNAGSGVIYGALTDAVSVGADRPLNRDWALGLSAGYAHNTALAQSEGTYPTFQDGYGGVQLSRRISETLSGYGSFTAIDQGSKNATGILNVYTGLNYTFAVGITFAPPPLVRGR